MNSVREQHISDAQPEFPGTHEDVDINAYFQRIGYNGKKEASLECLETLHFLHPKSIPFENLNPFLRIPVLLDLASIQQKLIHRRRGGYCFEHNLLFGQVLKALGFRVKGLAARVLWNQPEGALTPRGHMVLLVEAEQKQYIADVGFGGLTLTAPLLLQTQTDQQTPHEIFRLMPVNDNYLLQAKLNGEWKSLYKFGLEEQFLPDYEVTNWYLSNNPSSHFVTGLIAARTDSDKRFALRGNNFSIHYLNGVTEKRAAETAEELQNLLTDVFKITLPESFDMDRAFQKVVDVENPAT